MRRANVTTSEPEYKRSTSSKYLSSVTAILLAISSAAAAETPSNPAPATTADNSNSINSLLVSIPDRKLALLENGQVVKVYDVAVGAPDTPSPAGRFKIVNRVVKPTYYHKGFVIRPGRANPLGNRWMGLDLKGYGIHGTNEPRSIGHTASHGCIRMGKQDVEDLFRRVRIGDEVTILSAPPARIVQVFESRPGSASQPKTSAQDKPLSPALRAAIAGSF